MHVVGLGPALLVSVGSTYIWGPSTPTGSRDFPIPTHVSLESHPTLSVIQLRIIRETAITIHLVKRGTDWPEDESFCSQMLPAVVRDFVARKELDISSLKEINVVNVSDPPIWGCICYTRTMLEFGFNTVNEEYSADEFCKHAQYYPVMTGEPSDRRLIRLGVSTPKQLEYLNMAIYVADL
jgi:hypothetical protein